MQWLRLLITCKGLVYLPLFVLLIVLKVVKTRQLFIGI